nr:hypothetical protein [Mycoplasmopsis bovis]
MVLDCLSALDNRPLTFDEFETSFDFQKIYISATPDEYELDKTNGIVTTLFVRPTGLLNPLIDVRPAKGQIEDIYDELQKQKERCERTLILTTTKSLAEELTRILYGEKWENCLYSQRTQNIWKKWNFKKT